MSKPPFAYYGGKMGMADRIVGLLPPHRVYIEPYFGSGAVLFAKSPAAIEIVNDLDDAVVAFFRCLRERPGPLEEACRLTPYARAEYDGAELAEDLDDLERARRFWVRVNQSFAKTAGRRTGWSVTTARTQSTANSVQGRLDRFRSCAARLASVCIEHCDGPSLIERMATSETVIYADPPYLRSTRVQAGEDYRLEASDDEHHRRLAEVLNATAAAVVLSGYPSPLYDELYREWNVVDVPVLAHSSNATTLERTERTERLWLNFDPDHGSLFANVWRGGSDRTASASPSHSEPPVSDRAITGSSLPDGPDDGD